jgi:hypothetical protein
MAKLNFTAGTSLTRKMKRVPSKYRQSLGRPNVSQSDGIRPAWPLMPFAGLAKGFEDISTQDSVVIPKGRIVSALTQNSDLGDGAEYYAVGKGIMGLMLPCNGSGSTRDIVLLKTDDDSYPQDTTECSAVGGTWSGGNTCTYTVAANSLPIGIAEHDVYQDINGTNLNYDMRNKNWGVLSHQLIKLSSVDNAAWDAHSGGMVDLTDGAMDAGGVSYLAAEKKYSWYYGAAANALAGSMVAADAYGNSTYAASAAAGTVGRLMGVDYRFNKDLLDTVQSKWDDQGDYQLAGTGTAGIPQHLYDFAYLCLTSDSGVDFGDNAPGRVVKELVDAGVFGEAWILLNL